MIRMVKNDKCLKKGKGGVCELDVGKVIKDFDRFRKKGHSYGYSLTKLSILYGVPKKVLIARIFGTR